MIRRKQIENTLYLTAAVVLLLATGLMLYRSAGASSHREAPLISRDQYADNTDVYAFISPNNPGAVVLIANYIPFEAPEGGPTYYGFDDNVIYEIHVDNDGDALPDFSYALQS